jgi:hypothetical protein
MNTAVAPTPQSTPPATDGYYDSGFVQPKTAASSPVVGFDGPVFRRYGDAWTANIARSSGH